MTNPVSRTFSAFSYRDFRLVWAGAFTSTTGTWMQNVAQAWVVLDLTGSAFYLGIDAFLATLPMLLFSLFAGVFADRFSRKRILILSQIFQMSFALILAALLFSGAVEVWHVFVLSFLTGTAQAFGGPAYQALLPLLVDREDVPNAIALNSMQFNLARMLGPVLAGIAMASVGAAVCFLLNGLSFLAVIVMLLLLETEIRPALARGAATIFRQIGDGIRFMTARRELTWLSILAFTTTFFGIPLVTLMPVVAKSQLELGPTGFSWLMAMSGAGSVSGALAVAAFGHTRRKGLSAIVFLFLLAVFVTAFAWSARLWLSFLLVFLSGTMLLGVIAMTASLVQLASSEEMRGRVMSIYMMAFRGGMPLGNLLSGWIADRYSVTWALTVNGIALAILAVAYLVMPTRVRDL